MRGNDNDTPLASPVLHGAAIALIKSADDGLSRSGRNNDDDDDVDGDGECFDGNAIDTGLGVGVGATNDSELDVNAMSSSAVRRRRLIASAPADGVPVDEHDKN